jgi:pimeloyl-ACP methyl ester carboxylesterase
MLRVGDIDSQRMLIRVEMGKGRKDQRRAAILARPVAIDLGAIAAPTLVMVGAEDRLIPPSHTLSLAHQIRDARTVTVTGVGHVATLQDLAAVAREVLAFLSEGEVVDDTTKRAMGSVK